MSTFKEEQGNSLTFSHFYAIPGSLLLGTQAGRPRGLTFFNSFTSLLTRFGRRAGKQGAFLVVRKPAAVPVEVPRSLRKDRCVNLFLILLGGALPLMAGCHCISSTLSSCFRASFPLPQVWLGAVPTADGFENVQAVVGRWKRRCTACDPFVKELSPRSNTRSDLVIILRGGAILFLFLEIIPTDSL